MTDSPRRTLGFALTGFLVTFVVCIAAALGAGLAQGAPASAPAHSGLPTGAHLLHDPVPVLDRVRSAFGYVVILAFAVLLSNNRRAINRRVVIFGVLTQIACAALFLLHLEQHFAAAFDSATEHFFGARPLRALETRGLFDVINDGFVWLTQFTDYGAEFVFRSFDSQKIDPPLRNFAFLVLPTIIFFCSLMTVLYHLGVMQKVVWVFAWVMQRTMKTSGAETLSAASNIFLGQTESPLLVKPFVKNMTMSELMAVMTGGFATIAGSVMAVYIGFLQSRFPQIGAHLMAASVLNTPPSLFLAKIMVPEVGVPETSGTLDIKVEKIDSNVVGAAARGASEGVQLAINVAAMLIAFVALVYLVNGLLTGVAGLVGIHGLTLQEVFAWMNWPFAWLTGASTEDCGFIASLYGEKLVLTELWSYNHLAEELGKPGFAMQERSVVIAIYGLLGFANFASIGIQIGGIGAIAPERRDDLARLGLRAMVCGTLCAYLSACLAGIVV